MLALVVQGPATARVPQPDVSSPLFACKEGGSTTPKEAEEVRPGGSGVSTGPLGTESPLAECDGRVAVVCWP